MADVPNITTEILVQIRDEMRGMRTELTGLRSELKAEMHELRGEMHELRGELKAEMHELRTIIIQHGRVVDGTLEASLEDSGRLDVLEGRVSVLEAEMREVRDR